MILKVIRDHCTSESIKDYFLTCSSDFNFQRQKSTFSFPTVKCPLENPRTSNTEYFNINHYMAGLSNKFKRTVAFILAST